MKRYFCHALLAGLLAAAPLSAAPLTATLAQWGSNAIAVVNFPAGLKDASAIAAGPNHALVVRANGTVLGWGDNSFGKATPPPGLNNVVAVAAGANHSVALRANGTVISWGANESGQTNTPAFTDATAIAASEFYNLAIYGGGAVAAWGSPPAATPALANVISIAAAPSYALAVVRPAGQRGYVVAWGYGAPAVPASLGFSGTLDVVAVAAGFQHAAALLSNGQVVVWGSNFFGQGNIPSGAYNILGISASGNYTLARRNDGAIFAWGDLTGSVTPPAGLSNVVAIAAGNQHALALFWEPLSFTSQPQSATALVGQTVQFQVGVTGSEPIAYQWQRQGTNLPGATNFILALPNLQTNQAGAYRVIVSNPVSSLTSTAATLTVLAPPVIVTPPQSQTVPQGALVQFTVSASGTAPLTYQWYKDHTPLPNANLSVLLLPNAQSFDAGAYHVVITNIAGAVTSSPATLTVLLPPIITEQPHSQTVLAGSAVTFRVTALGATAYQWRRNNANLPAANGPVLSLTAVTTNDAGFYQVIVSNDGGNTPSDIVQLTVLAGGESPSLVAWGQEEVFVNPVWVSLRPPGGLSNLTAIALGGQHGLVLRRDGTVVGWGDNTYGQAAPPPGLNDVKAIAAGLQHSVALRSNGTLVAWGRNHLGQTNAPGGVTDIKTIAAGAHHTLALRANGSLVAWGDNAYGKASVFPSATNLVAIAAGADHSLAVRSNGTVVAWGNNDDGQVAVPPGLSNVIAVAAGSYHSLALRRDGTVVGWGAARPLFNYDQANPPLGLSNVIAIAAGDTHSLALLANNTVVGWGANTYGQRTPPAALAGVALLAAGPSRSLALVLPPLKISPPRFLGGGVMRLEIANRDASPLDADRLNRIQLWTTTRAAGPAADWTVITNAFVPLGSGAVFTQTNTTPSASRFFRLTEQP
ncbi:immunoglobulin domain-containing protein [Fontisphaera persica]|uniref:immunoglobulin domain-containing protein n=1 Tax=Fontisphaera persica TaxID=2974023 RepID=UPI0024BFCC55|nr:immunoglobulin domain-containing protein [Fontisphaera persica]WCJ59323.1 immunoglobulin domain-containing protein [Fontisphaera persica]